MKLIPRIQEISYQQSEETGISKNMGEFIVESFFKNMKKKIQEKDMPTIMIHSFGEFRPSLYFLNRRIEFLEDKLKEEIKDDYRNRINKELENLQKVKKRIKSEKTKRRD